MNIKVFSQYKNTLIGLIIIVAFVFIIKSEHSHYSLEKEEIALETQELEEGADIVARWDSLRSDAEDLASRFLTEDTLFFKKFVEEKANTFGIQITSLKTSTLEEDFYWEVAMQLGMVSSYKSFMEFVDAIEEKGVAIEKVKVLSERDTKTEAIELTLKGFIIKK